MDKKTQEAIIRVTDGSLASGIKKNMRYATTGIALGAMVGIGIATFFGGSRVLYALGGAAIGGGLGYLTAPKGTKKEETETIETKQEG